MRTGGMYLMLKQRATSLITQVLFIVLALPMAVWAGEEERVL